mgnify:FL=1
MRKRLAFLLVLLIVFLLSGCSTIPLEEQKLEEYKNIAIQELNIYLETKLANNFYDDAGHNNLVSIVENSIVEIQNAEKKTAIDLIEFEAKRDMDFVEAMEEITSISFFALQEVYDAGEVSQEDLITMSYLVSQNESLSVSSLSIQIMQRIKQEYSYLNNIKLENLNLEYFGNYNGYYALIMYDITTGVAAVVTKVEIGDVVFYYPTTGIEIIMCKIN